MKNFQIIGIPLYLQTAFYHIFQPGATIFSPGTTAKKITERRNLPIPLPLAPPPTLPCPAPRRAQTNKKESAAKRSPFPQACNLPLVYSAGVASGAGVSASSAS